MNLKSGQLTGAGSMGAKGEVPTDGHRARGAGRRRGAELENAILDAAWDVLVEHGYSGFTYEAIAARAGTSRPVLYRRWPQREDLLLATLARHWQPIEVPDTGSLRDDAIDFLRNASTDRAQTVILMNIQLGDYFRDTGTSASDLREALGGSDRPAPFEQIVARAVARGELPDEQRPSRIINLPFDLLRHDMLTTLRPVPDEAVTEIVDQVWLPLLKPSEPR
ncbi:TetR/AcrR family transcriptional regulator [Streptomyces sp. NPDC042319]|uniref:TetR/AcrR family transcriptional regulator n=1 Tax=Streptomyces sp. NPDC042319 TaxID=3154332 RepID=UPI0033C95A7C